MKVVYSLVGRIIYFVSKMGRVKALVMDQEYYGEWLNEIFLQLSKTEISKRNSYLRYCLRKIQECVSLINNGELQFEAVNYLYNEKEHISDIVEKICSGDKSKDWVNILFTKVAVLVNKFRLTPIQLNSEDYYKDKVETLESDKEKLTRKLASLSNQHGKEQEENRKQIASLNSELRSKEEALQDAKKQYERAKSQVEAQENINTRITASFLFLSQKSGIIEEEKKRLNLLYYAYMIISGLILIGFLIVEIIMWYYLLQERGLICWVYYIRFYLPVPLCTGLLWFSVYQMNRAQRQILNIANQLHSIKYVESLLLALNNMSLDAKDGLHKVQNALDQIVEKYIGHLDWLSEEAISRAIAKDKVSVDIDKLTSLVNTIQATIKRT